MNAPTKTPTPTLYHLAADMLALDALLEEQTAESTEADVAVISKWFEEMECALAEKLARSVAWAKSQEALAEVAKGESKRLAELAKRRLNNVERLKRVIHDVYTALDLKRVDTPLGPIRLVSNGGALPVLVADSVNAMDLPDGCWKATATPLKEPLRERLERGETIDGVTLGVRGTRIELG